MGPYLDMNKFLFIFLIIIIASIFLYVGGLVYFPLDIKNLFPLFHFPDTEIPHNTLVSDPFTEFEPWRYFAKQQLLDGQFPLWNSLNSHGAPFFANAQSAILFPLNFIYYFFPVKFALNLIPLLKFFLLFLFSYLYFRSLKITEKISLIGSFAVTFSGFPIVWVLWPHTNVFMFLPLFLYITEKIANNKKNNHRWYVLLAVTYCFSIFGGHFETLRDIMMLHGFYVIFRVKEMRKMILICTFIVIGFLLAAIQLLPFLEYFLNSYVLQSRSSSPHLYLPAISFVLNFFPFILGAPHLQFYKPISEFTNFQESMGGYTGFGVFLYALFGGMVLHYRRSLVKFWVIITFLFWMLAYKIWPFGLLLELPLMSQAQNSRLSSISGFAIAVLFALSLSENKIISNYVCKKRTLLLILLIFSPSFIIGAIFIAPLLLQLTVFTHPFYKLFQYHISFIVITTSAFLSIMLVKRKKIDGTWTSLFIACIIFSQSLFLLFRYIPLVEIHEYYPSTKIISKIQENPDRSVLEIGNPSLPPNTNLIYGVKHIEDYDAIEILSYKEALMNSFSKRNHWGKVDYFSHNSLERFGVGTIISDFNINDKRQLLQDKQDELIRSINMNPVRLSFLPKGQHLSGIRFLPANFNRKNYCTIEVRIMNSFNDKVFDEKIPCANLLDKMYYTLDVGDVQLEGGNLYTLEFKSSDSKMNSAVGLWGHARRPYVEMFFREGKNKYELLLEDKGVKLFDTHIDNFITTKANFSLVHNDNTQTIITYSSANDTQMEIKRSFYPGWKASIDGKKVKILKSDPFMLLNLPKGDHVITLRYNPKSFLYGKIVSLISLLFIAIYFTRMEISSGGIAGNLNKYSRYLKLRGKLEMKKFIISCSIFIFVFSIFALCGNLFKFLEFKTPFTTSVNWLIVNNHSLTKDYLLLLYISISIVTSYIFALIFYLWKRK